jgi:cytochrome P450 family 307 subfamily A
VQKYGPVVGLRLGLMRCAVVQNDELIREVLITKADHFDSRPNFVRFHAIFGGSKKNGESSPADCGNVFT